MSIRDRIKNADDRTTRTVEVPEWGMVGSDALTIRSLSGKERDKFESSMLKMNKAGKQEQNLDNIRARLTVLVVIDPNDNDLPVFTEKDLAWLGDKSAAALDRVFTAAQEHNGFTKKDVEDLAKGFDSDPSESSTTD